MTTATKLQEQEELLTALYCRLSVDDIKEDAEENESNSIKNQKTILEDYCKKNGITNYRFFVDAPVIIGLKTLRREKCWKRGAF